MLNESGSFGAGTSDKPISGAKYLNHQMIRKRIIILIRIILRARSIMIISHPRNKA